MSEETFSFCDAALDRLVSAGQCETLAEAWEQDGCFVVNGIAFVGRGVIGEVVKEISGCVLDSDQVSAWVLSRGGGTSQFEREDDGARFLMDWVPTSAEPIEHVDDERLIPVCGGEIGEKETRQVEARRRTEK